MRLVEARRKFRELRQDPTRIAVRQHAWRDHPERRFSPPEIVELIHLAAGELRDNRAPTAQPESFVFHCKDGAGRRCELVVRFEIISSTG